MLQELRTYKDRRLYEKDAKRLTKAGWLVESVTEHQPRTGCMRFIMMGGIGALVFRPKSEIMVNYRRTVEAARAETEQNERIRAERRRHLGQGEWLWVLLGAALALIGVIGFMAGDFGAALVFLVIGTALIQWMRLRVARRRAQQAFWRWLLG